MRQRGQAHGWKSAPTYVQDHVHSFLCCPFFTPPPHPNSLLQVLKISYVEYQKDSMFEATCVPVERDSRGNWVVPEEWLARDEDGPAIEGCHLKDSEFGVKLYCLNDPKSPVKKTWLDEYIAAQVERDSALVTNSEGPPTKRRKGRKRTRN